MQKRNRQIQLIDSTTQMKCTKSRRSKNLMKKSYELSVLCGLNVNLIIYDPKRHKMQEYSSNPNFTLEKINELIYPKHMI